MNDDSDKKLSIPTDEQLAFMIRGAGNALMRALKEAGERGISVETLVYDDSAFMPAPKVTKFRLINKITFNISRRSVL